MKTTLRALSMTAALCLACAAAAGCYTGHAVDRQVLVQMSVASTADAVTSVQDQEGATVPVTANSVVMVTDNDGLRHALQAFSFEVSQTQLVAPDADMILGLSTIERIEVRQLSTASTLGLVGVVVASAATAAGLLVATAGDNSMSR